MFALTHWPDVQEYAPDVTWIPFFDKLVHFSLYCGWAILCWCAVSSGYGRLLSGQAAWIAVVGATYGVIDEVTQAIVEREPDITDWCADLLGLGVGLLIIRFWRRRRAREPISPAAPRRSDEVTT